ncbi:MAG TPA: hypothetical protein VMG59_09425 [Phycisphaerae bacterium]|nr:hypothetical protein [Phycisphaerae bacterium]
MKQLSDRYTFVARFLPAALVLLPAGLALAAWFPSRFDGWPLLIGLLTTGGMAALMAQIARDAGKKKESTLWTGWGGQPTVLQLRHRHSNLDQLTLKRYHSILAALVPGTSAWTPEEEKINPTAADDVYLTWTRYLREATRDREKFAVLFSENISYGFRRNLWSMKLSAVIIAIVSIAAVAARIGLALWTQQPVPPLAGVVAAINIILLFLWVFHFTPSWVRLPADAYAERLLASCEQLSSNVANPTERSSA